MKRRQEGQDLQRFRDEQEQRRNDSWIKERQKEKEEERKAREHVKARMEQNRQERLSRQNSSGYSVPPSTADDGETSMGLV